MASKALPRATPESVGISSTDIIRFIDEAKKAELGIHSLMVARRGSVVTEAWWPPYQPNDIHLLYSLSKSFMSSAIGFAVQEGRLSVQDTVVSFFGDKLPSNPSANLLAMTIQDLLTMSCGHDKDEISDMYMREDGDWVRGFLAREVPHIPGTHFLYNSSASFVLSAILQRVTGSTTIDYLRPRLLDPLGIENATWESNPEGINMGGWGMSITTDAILRFGQFYLQKGMWEGKQILSESWIEEATRFHVSNENNEQIDWKQGYGYQFWRSRHNAYRGDGAFGQFCVVLPEQDMVVAITSGVSGMQAVLNLVWDHLVGPISETPLAANPDSLKELQSTISQLELMGPKGALTSPIVSSIHAKTFVRSEKGDGLQSCVLSFGDDSGTLTLEDFEGEYRIEFGIGKWVSGITDFQLPNRRIGARAAWLDDDLLEIKVVHLESPTTTNIQCKFDGDAINLTTGLQFIFGPSEGPSFNGKLS